MHFDRRDDRRSRFLQFRRIAVFGIGTVQVQRHLVRIGLLAQVFGIKFPAGQAGQVVEHLLPDLIGWQKAADLLLTARWVDAAEAVDLGLALRRVPDADIASAARELAIAIASKSAYATRVIKQTMVAGRGSRIRDARDREERLYTTLFRSGGFGS